MPRTALFDKFPAAPARSIIMDGSETPACFTSLEEEYWALKRSSGAADLSYRGRMVVRGGDAARFLHGMVTNEIKALPAGSGNYAFLLNVQGHILADVHILRLDEQTFLLGCEPQSYEVIRQQLDRHIIADDVELIDQRSELACLAIEGPLARQELARAVAGPLPDAAFHHIFREDLQARIVRASLAGSEGFWIYAAPDKASALLQAVFQAGSTSFRPVGYEALETCRIEAGIPRYGVDITEKNLVQETGQMQAVSFNKGCYIGQEVVERVRSRGHVNRKLVQLVLEGRQQVAPGTPIVADGETVGTTGSSAYCFGLAKTVAFGVVRREYAEAGRQAIVSNLPATIRELPGANSN